MGEAVVDIQRTREVSNKGDNKARGGCRAVEGVVAHVAFGFLSFRNAPLYFF